MNLCLNDEDMFVKNLKFSDLVIGDMSLLPCIDNNRFIVMGASVTMVDLNIGDKLFIISNYKNNGHYDLICGQLTFYDIKTGHFVLDDSLNVNIKGCSFIGIIDEN